MLKTPLSLSTPSRKPTVVVQRRFGRRPVYRLMRRPGRPLVLYDVVLLLGPAVTTSPTDSARRLISTRSPFTVNCADVGRSGCWRSLFRRANLATGGRRLSLRSPTRMHEPNVLLSSVPLNAAMSALHPQATVGSRRVADSQSRCSHLGMITWLQSIAAVSPLVLTVFAYWRGLHTAQRLLPKERRANGDDRVVPDLYSPDSSHRWFAIVVNEKTRLYSPRLQRALAQARVACVLLPFAFGISAVLLGHVPREQMLPDRLGFVVSLPR